MSSHGDEKLIEGIKELLNKIGNNLYNLLGEVRREDKPGIASKLGRILSQVDSVREEIDRKREHINNFIGIVKKVRIAPIDLLDLLHLSEVPLTSVGRALVERIVGYRGLGIETMDHYISEVTYEDVEKIEDEMLLSDISITRFIYRVPPFELSRYPYERGKDAEITKILGAKHVWLVKPESVSESSWRNIQAKTAGRRNIDVIRGKYDKVGSIVQLRSLELVDITRKYLEIEIERPIFFLKLGSKKLEDDLKHTNSKERLLKVLRSKEEQAPQELGERSSWRIRLDYVYFCYRGLAISTDPYDLECPFMACPLRDKGCDGRRYWSATYYKRKPYPKIYPLRSVKPIPGGVLIYEERLPKDIVVFKAYDRRRVESAWYGVEMGTWFIRSRPTIRIRFDKNAQVGYSIPTSLLEISFNINWLNYIVRKILEENDEIRKSVALKFILYRSLRQTLDYERLAKAIDNIIERREEAKEFEEYYKNKKISGNLLIFARRLLLHSLEHLLTNYVLFKLVGVDYDFIMTRYYYKKDVAKIFIVENAKNGRLGIVDTVAREVENKGLSAFLIDLIDWLETFLDDHDREYSKLSHERKNRAIRLIDETIRRFEQRDRDKADRLKQIIDRVREFSDKLRKASIQMDVTLARTTLLVSGRVSEDLIEELEDYFDDILEMYEFPLCWDGCNACVRLERYCGEGVHQILTTSKMLLKVFIKYLRSLIASGISETSREMGKVIEPLLQGSRRSIDVSSPFISPRYARMLIDKSKQGVKVRVLTWMPKPGEEGYDYHVESLRILRENLNDNLEVRIANQLHAKIYLVDGKIAITGSANLTESGMYGNLEHIDMKLDPKLVSEINRGFDELWNISRDIRQVNI